MKDYIAARASELGEYIVENKATVRDAANARNVSKSTVHKDVTERLAEFDPELADAVQKILDINLEERHLRGGAATARKYGKQLIR